MKKRELNKVVILEPAKSRLERNECPSCGLPKSKWKRRKDWRCCSIKCTEDYYQYHIYYGWQEFRIKALIRDKYTCVKCGDNRREVEVIIKDKRIINFAEVQESGWKVTFKYEKFERKTIRTNFVVDHIEPIALGGDEWDLDNLQTLCLKCNKIKTSQDMKDINKQRRIEKSKIIKTEKSLK